MYRRRRVGDASGIVAPFKPPQLKKLETVSRENSNSNAPISKKLKLETPPKRHERKLASITPTPTPNPEPPIKSTSHKQKFSVVWRKFSTKKNKKWEGDGTLVIENEEAIFRNEHGKELSRSKMKNVSEGDFVKMGLYEIQVDSPVAESEPKSEPPPPSNVLPVLQLSINGPAKKINTSSLFDANSPDAIVMPRPRPEPLGKTIIDVVVDPFIGTKLRPHQVEGLKFIYQCIMGMKHHKGRGALLADEMGLGKTLLTISLIWTLLKQNPIQGESPVLKRVLIVCPVTLISNWQKEFRKWLGRDRIGVFIADSKARIRDFTGSRVYPIMIIGYEKVRTLVNDLRGVKFDLIVCDEGHRLKSSNNKSAQALLSLGTEKKLILSGTPIQNDLGEFFTMIDFLNPGVLGSYASFKKEFENPIMKSRQPGTLKKDLNIGKEKSDELSKLTKQFIIRRTAKTLDNYLPPKTETVLFCYPTKIQLEKYKQFLDSSEIKGYLGSNDSSDHLRAITLLKKVCNSPSLVEENSTLSNHFLPTLSGKSEVLLDFLKILHNETNEKVVIVSGYTQTLDMIENMIRYNGMTFLRLDGSTNQNKRQQLVDSFNKNDQDSSFVFLLSSRSGGVGLNLVGASRLFLFDTDWNPSIDLQAMARIHRDGQKNPVFIYRLLVTGMMDEKIYQRQVTKQGLADRFMGDVDEKDKDKVKSVVLSDSFSSDSFTSSELKELFVLHESTVCNTHEILECKCLEISSTQGVNDDTNGESQDSISTSQNYEDMIGNNSIESGNGGNDKEDSNDSDNDVDEEEDDLGGWVSAKIVADEGIHIPKRMKKKDKLKGLFDYNHVNPINDLSNVHDELLLKVLKLSKSISFIFTKSTVLSDVK